METRGRVALEDRATRLRKLDLRIGSDQVHAGKAYSCHASGKSSIRDQRFGHTTQDRFVVVGSILIDHGLDRHPYPASGMLVEPEPGVLQSESRIKINSQQLGTAL